MDESNFTYNKHYLAGIVNSKTGKCIQAYCFHIRSNVQLIHVGLDAKN